MLSRRIDRLLMFWKLIPGKFQWMETPQHSRFEPVSDVYEYWMDYCPETYNGIYSRRPEKEERAVKRRSSRHIFQQCVVQFPLIQSLNIDISTHLYCSLLVRLTLALCEGEARSFRNGKKESLNIKKLVNEIGDGRNIQLLIIIRFRELFRCVRACSS